MQSQFSAKSQGTWPSVALLPFSAQFLVIAGGGGGGTQKKAKKSQPKRK